jgi:hypothetical protein
MLCALIEVIWEAVNRRLCSPFSALRNLAGVEQKANFAMG